MESASNMDDIIDAIRSCNQNCYKERYKFPLKTTGNRTISVNELLQGKPLIDDWRNQKVLFISQAPSKQAWADNELSSLENNFFSGILLPKVFPSLPLREKLENWKNIVFWTHTANCYPYIHLKGRKGDRLPDLKCANRYLNLIIENMKPELIILMGWSSTRFFAKSLRKLVDRKKGYPPLEDILNWQRENDSNLLIKPKDGNSEYRAVAIPHAADWGKLSDIDKFSYELVIQQIREVATSFQSV